MLNVLIVASKTFILGILAVLVIIAVVYFYSQNSSQSVQPVTPVKSASTTEVLLNNTNSNLTIYDNQTILLNYAVTPPELNTILYVNGTVEGGNFNTTNLQDGFYNVTAITSSSDNYTGSSDTQYLTILPANAINTQNHYLNLSVGEAGQVELPVNPSTGTSWWVQSAPSNIEVNSSSSVNTSITCPSGIAGCSNQLTVYSFMSNESGNYTVELRLGHAWAHEEYYEVDLVYLTVQNSSIANQSG